MEAALGQFCKHAIQKNLKTKWGVETWTP